MKKSGILHPELSRVIAELGHGDMLVLADAGLPIPLEVERIDLAFAPGKPGFLEVLEAILGEVKAERAILAEEIRGSSASFEDIILTRLGDIPAEYVPHQKLKHLTQQAKAVVRTGEFTPYANVILLSGVVF